MCQLLVIKSQGPSRYYAITNNERGSLEATNVDLQRREPTAHGGAFT